MAKLYIKEATTLETSSETEQTKSLTECEDCSKIEEGSPGLIKEEEITDCAGEWTHAWAWINDPSHQYLLIIPSARNLADAVNKTGRCGGDPKRVWYSSSPVMGCAPYIRCNL